MELAGQCSLHDVPPPAITYDVLDISSGHCRAAIEAEVGAVPGVETIRVDLEAATVAVTGATLDDTAIPTAIYEAGYEAR